MTRAKTRWLAAAALLCVPLAPLAILAWTGANGGGEDQAADGLAADSDPQGAIPLSGVPETDWVVGDKYELTVAGGGVSDAYFGKLLKIDERWVVVRSYMVATSIETTWLSDVPVIGSYFNREHDRLGQEDQWFPREAVTIVSHATGHKMPALLGVLGDEPAAGGDYSCRFLRGAANQELHGNLIAVAGDDFTFQETCTAPQTIARGDVICISTSFADCKDLSEMD